MFDECPKLTPNGRFGPGNLARLHAAILSISAALPENTPDIARLLREQAGYKTALVGKAHFEPASAPGGAYVENYAASQNITGPHRGFDHTELCGHTGRAGRSLFHYPKWLEETHQDNEGELYDLMADLRQFVNLWDDPARQNLKSDLIAEMYDNLPPTRTPPLKQIALA